MTPNASAPSVAPVIGLVGQICAGKSSVARAFEKLGALRVDADRLVHEIYEQADVKAELKQLFGAGVFDCRGEVDRRKLGTLVFADPQQLKTLTERVIFPRTGEKIAAEIARFRATAAPALVLEAPTLFESGRADWCDRLVFVEAPLERRSDWARSSRGWSPEELEKRSAHLQPEAKKRARCHAVVRNAGTLDELDQQVSELWKQWITH